VPGDDGARVMSASNFKANYWHRAGIFYGHDGRGS